MTVAKYINIYEHSKLTPDQIRGRLRDLNEPDPALSRDEIEMKREALSTLLRQTIKQHR